MYVVQTLPSAVEAAPLDATAFIQNQLGPAQTCSLLRKSSAGIVLQGGFASGIELVSCGDGGVTVRACTSATGQCVQVSSSSP